MTERAVAETEDTSGREAATVAATVAATGRVRPERVEVVLASDQRRAHAPELRARLVSEVLSGQATVAELSRREGICESVLHRWHRRARLDAGLPVTTIPARLLPVRTEAQLPAPTPRPVVGLEVVLGNGRVLRVPPGTDPALVAQMAAALER